MEGWGREHRPIELAAEMPSQELQGSVPTGKGGHGDGDGNEGDRDDSDPASFPAVSVFSPDQRPAGQQQQQQQRGHRYSRSGGGGGGGGGGAFSSHRASYPVSPLSYGFSAGFSGPGSGSRRLSLGKHGRGSTLDSVPSLESVVEEKERRRGGYDGGGGGHDGDGGGGGGGGHDGGRGEGHGGRGEVVEDGLAAVRMGPHGLMGFMMRGYGTVLPDDPERLERVRGLRFEGGDGGGVGGGGDGEWTTRTRG